MAYRIQIDRDALHRHIGRMVLSVKTSKRAMAVFSQMVDYIEKGENVIVLSTGEIEIPSDFYQGVVRSTEKSGFWHGVHYIMKEWTRLNLLTRESAEKAVAGDDKLSYTRFTLNPEFANVV